MLAVNLPFSDRKKHIALMEWKFIPIISPSPLPYPHYIPIKTCHLGMVWIPKKRCFGWVYGIGFIIHGGFPIAPLTPLHHAAPGCWRGRRRGCSPGRERSSAPPRASEAWPFSATLMPYSKPHILRCPWPSLRPIKIGRSRIYRRVAPTFPQPFWVG